MPSVRTYKCGKGHNFEHYHASMDEPLLDYCPHCVADEKLSYVPGGLHIGGSARSKAEKLGFEIAQNEYGLTNMRDKTYEGENIIVPPPALQGDMRALNDHIDTSMKQLTQQTDEQKKAAQNFWAGGANPQQSQANQQSMLNLAKAATAETRASFGDPMKTFHDSMRKNPADQVRFRIIAK